MSIAQPFIAVCICSRGLVFSKTVEATERNLATAGIDKRLRLWTHDLPIPDAQNDVVTRALFAKVDYIWMVEEDMRPEDNVLKDLLASGHLLVSADYKLRNGDSCARYNSVGTLLYSGIGCLLIHRSVFDLLGFPYFHTGVAWSVIDDQFVFAGADKPDGQYGGHDVDFFARLSKLDIFGHVISTKCWHMSVERLGDLRTNSGCHSITER